jgi:micrococcal nuclease
MKRWIFTIALLCLAFAGIRYPKSIGTEMAAPDAAVTAQLVYASDGDSGVLAVGAEKWKFRLAGIDTPEATQAYGLEAKAAFLGRARGHDLRAAVIDTDQYGRKVVELSDESGSINDWLLATGNAWHFVKYDKSAARAALAAKAKAQRLGLWASASPLPPWEFRAAKRKH